jgi:hypothetical protein
VLVPISTHPTVECTVDLSQCNLQKFNLHCEKAVYEVTFGRGAKLRIQYLFMPICFSSVTYVVLRFSMSETPSLDETGSFTLFTSHER